MPKRKNNMGWLLKQVKSTDKGLVGITREDEEVPLSEPTLRIKHFYNLRSIDGGEEFSVDVDEVIKGILMLRTSDKTYIQIGEIKPLYPNHANITIVGYNEFQRR
jgi:hypothetical protein